MPMFQLKYIQTGHIEALYEIEAKSKEEAERYLEEHRLELEPVEEVPLRDEGEHLVYTCTCPPQDDGMVLCTNEVFADSGVCCWCAQGDHSGHYW